VSRAEAMKGNGALMGRCNIQRWEQDLLQLSLHSENKNKGAC